MGGLNSIFKIWPALTILFSALSLVFETISRSSVMEKFGIVWMLGRVWDGRVKVTKSGELPVGRYSFLAGLRSSSQSLDQVALTCREFWRISWCYGGR